MRIPQPSGWFALFAFVSAPAVAQCPTAIDLTPGAGFTRPEFYEKAFGRELFFALDTPATGIELWKWIPATGVVLVADVKPGPGTSRPEQLAACCTALGPRLFFTASATGINAELWMTTGTPGNFTQVAEIRPGSSGSLIGNMTPVGNRLFFTANDGSTGNELWVTDGTGAGTYLVKDIRSGSNSNPQHMVALGDLLVFSADDGSGRDLWVSDGTTAGTISLNDQIPALGPNPYETTANGDFVFFTTGDELWKTDGTVAGTTMVQDLRAKWSVTSVSEMESCGGRVFFSASQPGASRILYVSDGTDPGTLRVQNDPFDAVSVRDLRCSKGLVFFAGSHWTTGQEMWISDGTHAGTVLAVDCDPGGSSSPAQIIPVGTGVIFNADDGINGREPWFSDGTPAGSFMLCDIHPTGSSSPEDFFMIGGQLWMEAFEPSVGDEPHILATPGAHVEQLGASGAPDYPTLETADGAPPVLGTTFNIESNDGPAGHLGLLFVGLPGYPAPPLPPLMQSGCDWVGLIAGTGFAVAGTASSSFSLPLTLPNTPGLEGAELQLQMVWFDVTAIPAIQMSNGLQLVLGEGAPH